MRIKFVKTPHNTIRVWMFDNSTIDAIRGSDEFKLFELVSCWNGYDQIERDGDDWIHSWELPLSLRQFIDEKFNNYKNCEIVLQ